MSIKKKILILHTGGTIGMTLDGDTVGADNFLLAIKKHVPRIFEIADIHLEIIFNKDSSNIVPKDWIELSKKIHKEANLWDAFVVTHGTDTMVFTAAALSFMLQHFPKPIIITGAQRPMTDARSDAPRNLLNAVEFAAEGLIKEVCVFFDSHLIRGNRVKKVSIPSFRAFDSPNQRPLAEVGVKTDYSITPVPAGPYSFDPRIETRVLSIPVFPGIDTEMFFGISERGVRGVLLQAFGPGDIPLGESSVVHLIRNLVERGIPTAICSQTPYGGVNLNLYETGRAAAHAGAISAGDMTWECALVKMMILLGRGLSMQPFRDQFTKNLAGELSPI